MVCNPYDQGVGREDGRDEEEDQKDEDPLQQDLLEGGRRGNRAACQVKGNT